ncbi:MULTISPECIES: ATP-binding protein [unclassified Colwellia]|uniref:ATP-binding protein n=1 Tax=unclassified Colwellia TaxID=196834 RepID=UPI0015F4DF47|nr:MULTISPECIES: AAA family ATPase [unclassified Colwellia]MBA6232190.1 AAA family ATPase [Colwellia sp. MB02u-7]MBA6237112.1 AAA family ATPase [Colwellia sp. MB02u-11]MBA6301624.1 AAA family ATPase [Colwellia sp. MB3u-22]MBA6311511.1 AAA family ATPase [Colwellia sp. MB3u-64]
MIIGLFGLSGSGKSTLTAKFILKYPEYIVTSASKIIADAKHRVLLNELNSKVVTDNQAALISGFIDFCKENANKNIIIELHNIIETPSGIVEIDIKVIEALNLDVSCFLSIEPDKLLLQRTKDKERVRFTPNVKELSNLQDRSLFLFKKLALKRQIIIKDNHYNCFEKYIGLVTKV